MGAADASPQFLGFEWENAAPGLAACSALQAEGRGQQVL